MVAGYDVYYHVTDGDDRKRKKKRVMRFLVKKKVHPEKMLAAPMNTIVAAVCKSATY